MSAKGEDLVTLSTVDVYELASVIGSQFEKLIDSYGSDSVANLMPTVIRVLEHLEELAKFSESERAETVELKFTIERLLAEKKLKAEERVKYEKVVCLLFFMGKVLCHFTKFVGKTTISILHDAQLLMSKQQQMRGGMYIPTYIF